MAGTRSDTRKNQVSQSSAVVRQKERHRVATGLPARVAAGGLLGPRWCSTCPGAGDPQASVGGCREEEAALACAGCREGTELLLSDLHTPTRLVNPMVQGRPGSLYPFSCDRRWKWAELVKDTARRPALGLLVPPALARFPGRPRLAGEWDGAGGMDHMTRAQAVLVRTGCCQGCWLEGEQGRGCVLVWAGIVNFLLGSWYSVFWI